MTSAFAAVCPNITVKFTVVPWETADQTYAAAFASSAPPDISYLPDQYMVAYADSGQLASLDKWVNDPSYATDKAAWFPGAWSLGGYKGVQYGIPVYGGAYVVYYNVDMWNQLGLGAPPTTEADLYAAAQKGTKAGQTYGFLAPSSSADSAFFQWFTFFHNHGLNFMNQALTANGFNNAEGLSVMNYITQFWCGSGAVSPPAGQYTLAQLQSLFQGGKALMFFDGMNDIAAFETAKLPFKWDFFMPPAGPTANTTDGNEGEYVVAAKSQHAEQAFKFIQFITNPAQLGPFEQVEGGFRSLRSDIPLSNFDSVVQKAQTITQNRVAMFEGQLSPKIREVMTQLWNAMEGGLTCQQSPQAAVTAAGQAVDTVLGH